MTNQEVSKIFRDIAKILEIKGENVFRIRAYERAAQTIEGLPENLEDFINEDRLTEIPGIGKDLSERIKEFAASGKIKVEKGNLPIFRNEDGVRFLDRPNTLLIDSAQLESGEKINPEFKKIFSKEIAL